MQPALQLATTILNSDHPATWAWADIYRMRPCRDSRIAPGEVQNIVGLPILIRICSFTWLKLSMGHGRQGVTGLVRADGNSKSNSTCYLLARFKQYLKVTNDLYS